MFAYFNKILYNIIMNSRDEVIKNALRIKEEIAKVSNDVTILGATKTVPYDVITALIEAGIDTIGENRVQEFTEKFVEGDGFHRHFIGQLQSNKAKLVVGRAELIHSLDRESLALEISRLATIKGITQDVLVEVNVGREESKGGVFPENAEEFIRKTSTLPGIAVKGIMGVFPVCSAERTEELYDELHALFDSLKKINIPNVEMKWLSAGMSGDYMTAIRHGANIVRLGSAIFGKRVY